MGDVALLDVFKYFFLMSFLKQYETVMEQGEKEQNYSLELLGGN
jgi:hypothetical protein